MNSINAFVSFISNITRLLVILMFITNMKLCIYLCLKFPALSLDYHFHEKYRNERIHSCRRKIGPLYVLLMVDNIIEVLYYIIDEHFLTIL